MRLSALLLVPAAAAAAATTGTEASPPPLSAEHLFSNPASSAGFKIPTSRESAAMARRILALTPLATLSTVFPPSSGRNSDVAGLPIGMNDYIADCEDDGNPTILSLTIGTSFRNVAHGSNISVSVAWVPPYPPARRIRSSGWRSLLGLASPADDRPDPAPYSAANLPRFAMIGYLEKIEPRRHAQVAACYVAAHPDAKYWLPGNPIHEAEWVRLVVNKVYWVGGFGDRAYIGWLSPEEWRDITRDEWEAVRLPGEKPGWKEWSIEEAGDL